MPPKRKPNPTGRAKKPDGQRSTTFFFYLPNDKPYGVFCQWHPSPITVPTSSLHFLATSPSSTELLAKYASSITFTCAEQVHMFAKGIVFADALSCTRILAKLGKAVTNFNEYKWTQVKSRVARVGNWYKFTNPVNKHMKEILLRTGDRELAEAARRDRVWGIGYDEMEAERYRERWGEKRLGKALMGVRDRVRTWQTRREEEGEGVGVEWEWDGGDEEVENEEMREDEEI
ncbi:hypothetical protein BKA63DRAFT_490938 [Paraphoma chrysanthemicola]|nr:hypothetical protein BKA63DRAFT_490938 [Paraphoma chrysanthemicola]